MEYRITPNQIGIAMPKCFVLMESDKDLSDLHRFGNVIILFTQYERRPSFWSEEFLDAALDKLEKAGYRHHTDYIVAAGSLVPLTRFLCALSVKCGSEPNLLLFDAQRQGYVPSIESTRSMAHVTRISNGLSRGT